MKPLLLLGLSFLSILPLSAAIMVDGNVVVRTLPDQIGGTMLLPWATTGQSTYYGVTNNTNYQSAFNQAGPAIARISIYPDYHTLSGTTYQDSNPANITANYDPKINIIRNNGAAPLFIVYTAPNNTTANSNILVADYVNLSGQNKATHGVTDGTLATNVAFLVKHYLGLDGGAYASNPLTMQYWEIGNEPDGTVNGQYNLSSTASGKTYVDYCNQFNSVDAQLRAISDGQGGTLRDHVKLCGPAFSLPYAPTNPIGPWIDYFLTNCAKTGACDIVTRHKYTNSTSTDTLATLLNASNRLEADFDAAYNHASSNAGEGGLQRQMALLGVPTTVGTGITEFNTSTTDSNGQFVGYMQHSIQQGLWSLLAQHYMIYNYHCVYGSAPGGNTSTTLQLNYQSLLSTGFIFDGFGYTSNSYNLSVSGFGYFTTDPHSSSTPWNNADYNYWACYLVNQMTASTVLYQEYNTFPIPVGAISPATVPLICTATKDDQYLYVHVINRFYNSSNVATALTEQIDLHNFPNLGAASVYTLSATTNNLPLKGGTPGTQAGGVNPSFTYTFPPESVTIFKFPIGIPLNGLAGYYRFEQNVNDLSGNGNNGTVRTGFTYSTTAREGSYAGQLDGPGGNGGRVVVSDSPSLRITGNLTLGAWVKPTTLTTQSNLIAKSFNSAYRLMITTTGFPKLALGTGTGTQVVVGTQTVTTGAWTHVAVTVTFTGSGTAIVKYYVNGVPEATPHTITLSAIQAGTGTLVLGCAQDWNSEALTGLLDQVTIYNRALSDSEILQLAH